MTTLRLRMSELFFEKKNKSFLEEIKNILVLGNIFGCAFINSENKFKITDFILAIPFYVTFLYCIPLAIRFYQDILEGAAKITYFSELVYFITNVIVTVLRPLYFISVRKFHYKILFKIDKLHFKITNGNYLTNKYNFDLLIFNCILMCNLVVYTSEYCLTKISSQTVASQIVFFSGMWIAVINDFVTYSVLKHINKLFAILNRKFETAALIKPHQIDYNPRRIRRYAYLHRALTKVSEDYNVLTSASMIGCASIGVTIVVLLMHFSTVTLIAVFKKQTADVLLMFFSLFWIGQIVVKVSIIIRSWLKVQSQAQKTATYIHDIWNNLASKDDINQRTKHLQLISLQLYNNKLSFTAYGFFALDWTLLHRVIAAVTTYVVILIQFEISSGTKDSYTNSTLNT